MAKLIISGGNKLEGRVKVAGSKNSALALIPACLLADSPITLSNVPVIRDVGVMLDIAEKLGAKVKGKGTNTVIIDPSGLKSYKLDPELSQRVRASVIFAASLLTRFGKAEITPPGGDQIGERLLDTHFSMMKEFGVDINKENGQYLLSWKDRKSTDVFLEEASVTATEMGLILASGLSSLGKITIEDAASEPHVGDLARLLSKMGAKIEGIGTNRLMVEGKKSLGGVEHQIIPDYIDGGTFIIAAVITGGQVTIENCSPDQYKPIMGYLNSMGVDLEQKNGEILEVKPSKLLAVKRKFQTRPWPGFPTDLMSPFIVLATQTEGTVLCHDWMYEWRIFFVDDLVSMGANIFIADPHRVVVTGPTKLHGEKLYSKDIRAGMSVVLAALCAQGESEIDNIEMVERGYEKIVERLTSLGADVKKLSSKTED